MVEVTQKTPSNGFSKWIEKWRKAENCKKADRFAIATLLRYSFSIGCGVGVLG